MTGEDLAAAALDLVGTKFRLHGRDPASGLDCIGLLAAALASCGRPARLPNGYALRNRILPELGAFIAGCGLVPAKGECAPGDIFLVLAGPGQFHLLVAAENRQFVHAHAGLRRVVRCDTRPDWPIIGHWRLATQAIEEQ